jgi:hypothetical protein
MFFTFLEVVPLPLYLEKSASSTLDHHFAILPGMMKAVIITVLPLPLLPNSEAAGPEPLSAS